ncbi:MAG: hypothetical protein MI802_25325 [Desulfobacterales bacterium]|nr:hypothetical protein [Desulfobacterales bacterium]
MPYKYNVSCKENIIYTRFYGVLTDADLVGQAKDAAANDLIRPNFREVVDLSQVREIKATKHSLDEIIISDKAHDEKIKGLKTAIVAPTDLLYGCSRMFGILTDVNYAPSTVQVFRTHDEARDWLQIPKDICPPI